MSELNLVDTDLGLRLIYTWCEYSCEVLVSEKHARVRLEWWSPVQVERLSLTLTVRGRGGGGGRWWVRRSLLETRCDSQCVVRFSGVGGFDD